MVESKYQIESSNHLCGLCSEQIPDGGSYFSAVIWADRRFGRRNFCPGCWARARRAAPDDPSRIEFFAYWLTRRPVTSDAPRERVRFDPEVVLQFFRRLGAGESDDDDAEESPESEDADAESPEAAGISAADAGISAADAGISAADAGISAADAVDLDGSEEPEESSVPLPSTALSSELGNRQRRELRFVLGLLLLRKKVLEFASSAIDDGREWLRLVERDGGRVHWVENPELSDDELTRVRDAIGELLQMRV